MVVVGIVTRCIGWRWGWSGISLAIRILWCLGISGSCVDVSSIGSMSFVLIVVLWVFWILDGFWLVVTGREVVRMVRMSIGWICVVIVVGVLGLRGSLGLFIVL